MPLHIDLITQRRLALVKQLYQHALIQFNSSHSFPSQIMTVIEFDLAIETALKAVISLLNPQFDLNNNFHELVRECERLYPKVTSSQFPHKGQIKRVHDIRNDAQHKAKYPNPNDVSDCRTYTRDFLEQIISDVWDRSLTNISLTELLKDTKAKELLVKAEDALSKGDIKEAAGQAVAAMEWVMIRVKESVVGHTEGSKSWGEFVMKQSGLSTPSGLEMYRTFWKMQETLFILALGLNYSDYVHYQETVLEFPIGVIIHPRLDHIEIIYGPCINKLDNNTAEYLVRYVIDTIMQIENHVDDFEKPFGIKHRTIGDYYDKPS